MSAFGVRRRLILERPCSIVPPTRAGDSPCPEGVGVIYAKRPGNPP